MAEAVHKKPPSSLEAERSVLGALLIDNLAYDRITDVVQREDFSIKGHQLIFEEPALPFE
jgi:replicative DNA helicase